MKFIISLVFIVLLINIGVESVFALKNPAAVYCEELGYEYTTINTDKGMRGLCILPDNQIVNAWWFLRGEIAQEYSYCKKMGYGIKTVEDTQKCSYIYSSKCAVCILEDGREVEVAELMNLSFAESVCGDDFCAAGMESFNSCPEDCPSGGEDWYCDGVADGKCDPDCEKINEKDPDCKERQVEGEEEIKPTELDREQEITPSGTKVEQVPEEVTPGFEILEIAGVIAALLMLKRRR
jgi:putative hemolysin